MNVCVFNWQPSGSILITFSVTIYIITACNFIFIAMHAFTFLRIKTLKIILGKGFRSTYNDFLFHVTDSTMHDANVIGRSHNLIIMYN